MRIGIYPGSFAPITSGHVDIIERASKLVDKLIVCVSYNVNKPAGLFTLQEKVDMVQKATRHVPNIQVDCHSGLLVDYAIQKDANVIIRGLRSITDFEYELQMSQINKRLQKEIETIFLVTDAQYSFVSSSAIKELVYFDGDIEGLVPKCIEQTIIDKIRGSNDG
ncbi:MAG: pantetheine-phosphate adenylyltransferase [Epulopiscium sp. Nele67-Bin004]|nr:MAG: pantetheine-phosphate adenylyltransferase [Epulopiscium sp. Nele67-Bin004]